MIRKLIQLSPSTSVVSLPASWLKKHQVQKGDDLQVAEYDNAITISTEKQRTLSSITIDLITFDEKLVYAHIDAAYIAGYDDISFLITAKQVSILQSVTNEVPGMIVYDQTVSTFRFKDITGNTREDVDVIINRIFNMIISLLIDAQQLCKDKNWVSLSKIKQKDYAINSYISYCLRQVNKFGYTTFSKTGLITTYLKLLEMLADKLCDLYIIVADKKIQVAKETEHLLTCFRTLQRIHEKYNAQTIQTLNKTRKQPTKHTVITPVYEQIQSLLFDLIEVEIQLKL